MGLGIAGNLVAGSEGVLVNSYVNVMRLCCG